MTAWAWPGASESATRHDLRAANVFGETVGVAYVEPARLEDASRVTLNSESTFGRSVGGAGNGEGAAMTQRIPVIGYAQAGDLGYFDDAGYPTGSGWDEVLFPQVGDPHAFALEIQGESMVPP